MAKGKTNPALVALLVGIVFIFVGGAVIGFSLMLGADEADNMLYTIMLYAGIGLAVLGIILLVGGIIAGKSSRRSNTVGKKENDGLTDAAEAMPDVEVSLDGVGTYNGMQTTYMPNMETYEFVTVGRRQSVEDKFDQIGKMSKTQFVVYALKLLSLKGFKVVLTPVIDNNGIDLLVTRDGITRGAACILSNKVLSKEDIKFAHEGESYYDVDGSMVITNMYFDRSALDYAKSHKMTLIDRNILIEQYMR